MRLECKTYFFHFYEFELNIDSYGKLNGEFCNYRKIKIVCTFCIEAPQMYLNNNHRHNLSFKF